MRTKYDAEGNKTGTLRYSVARSPDNERILTTNNKNTPAPSVCFVAPTAYSILSGDPDIRMVGGAELQQVIIANELADRGFDVSMICIDHGQEDAAVFGKITAYKCFNLRAGIPVIRSVYPRATQLWSALKRANADIYFQRTAGRYTGIVATFARSKGKRSVYSAANDPDFAKGLPKIRFPIDKWIFSYGIRNVDRIIVQNEHQRSLCRERFGRASTVISNCLPNPSRRSADRNGTVLWVATLKREKRPELFVELARQNPDIQFQMVGGPSRTGEAFFQEIASAASQLSNLEFVGFVPFSEIDRYFDGARLLVNTSDYEGFPNTFLQAWSRQIPTVSFLDLRQSTGGQTIGRIADSVEDMSVIVRRLMADDDLWRRDGQRCQEHFDRAHSVDTIVDQFERVFRDLADKKP